MSDETRVIDEASKVRLESMIESVDLDLEVDAEVEAALGYASMAGTELPNRYQRLFVLLHRKRIVKAEYDAVIAEDARLISSGEKAHDEVYQPL